MSSTVEGYVFGYGSLADPHDWLIEPRKDLPPGIYGELEGYIRHWDLAMRNDSPANDHKYFVDAVTQERFSGYVATLGIESGASGSCNGVAVPVDEVLLDKFDRREGGLYNRSEDLSSCFSPSISGPLWTYIPKESALDAFRRGSQEDRVWLPRDYYVRVREVFSNLVPDGLGRFDESTKSLLCPLRDLKMVRAPGDAGI